MNRKIGISSIAVYSEKELTPASPRYIHAQKAEYARNGIYTVMVKPLPIFKRYICIVYAIAWRGFPIEHSDIKCPISMHRYYVMIKLVSCHHAFKACGSMHSYCIKCGIVDGP